MQQNLEFSSRLLSALAVDPHGSETTNLMQALRESQLADLWRWLTKHTPADDRVDNTPIGPTVGGFTVLNASKGMGWYWLRLVVVDALIQRGTCEAVEEIRRLGMEFPEHGLRHAVEVGTEVLRQKSWRPTLPSEFLKITTDRALKVSLKASHAKPGENRGRRRNEERRAAIRDEISAHGDDWRDHVSEIFSALDQKEVEMGDFAGRKIDLGDGQSEKAWKWEDLDLATGAQRRQILDAMRKYLD